jgi:hypothetical protein
VQLGERDLRGSIDGDEEIELAGFGLDLDDIDMEVADGVSLELPLCRLVATDFR